MASLFRESKYVIPKSSSQQDRTVRVNVETAIRVTSELRPR